MNCMKYLQYKMFLLNDDKKLKLIANHIYLQYKMFLLNDNPFEMNYPCFVNLQYKMFLLNSYFLNSKMIQR